MDEEKTTYSLSDSDEKKSGEAFVATENKNSDFSFDDLDDSPLSFLSRKTVSLIIGILVVALLVPFLIFSFSRSKTKSSSTNAGKQVAQNKTTPTPTQKPAQKKKTPTYGGGLAQNNTTKGGLPLSGSASNSNTMSVSTMSKKYVDPTFGYSVTIPGNWEAFVRAGSGNAYQVAFRPIGSLDIPFTIGAQPGVTESNWINAAYGTNYPRANTQVAGRSAISVNAPTYISYYTHDSSYTYEISEALGKPEYNTAFNTILSSLTFSH